MSYFQHKSAITPFQKPSEDPNHQQAESITFLETESNKGKQQTKLRRCNNAVHCHDSVKFKCPSKGNIFMNRASFFKQLIIRLDVTKRNDLLLPLAKSELFPV